MPAWYRRSPGWLSTSRRACRALTGYLGTPNETDFDEVNGILAQFKRGDKHIALKRMAAKPPSCGMTQWTSARYRCLSSSGPMATATFCRAWTFPVLLNSTPAETLAHRRARNRDGKTDSAFTTIVLELEQQKLDAQAHKAKIILSKGGELLGLRSLSPPDGAGIRRRQP